MLWKLAAVIYTVHMYTSTLDDGGQFSATVVNIDGLRSLDKTLESMYLLSSLT